MSADEEHDWLFDYVLQFLESDRFDAEVMDFVDEKCIYFDSDEENKLEYTDIHRDFKDHMEAVISSNIGELGVTPEIFYEACEKGRHSRDINRTVFEKVLALDDFVTFKKMMVKRNTELEMETMRSIKNILSQDYAHDFDSKEDPEAALRASLAAPVQPLPDAEELAELTAVKEEELAAAGPLSEEEVQQTLRNSLLDMELIHKQEELERLELEQAIAMSLAVEHDRIKQMRLEMDILRNTEESTEDKQSSKSEAPAKGESKSSRSSKAVSPQKPLLAVDDPKPLRMKGELAPLPGIKPRAALAPIRSSGPSSISSIPRISEDELAQREDELEEKRRIAEDIFQRNQEQQNAKKRQEQELRGNIAGGGGGVADDAEKRAKYMREQRDRLLAIKKKEREEKVRAEEERRAKAGIKSYGALDAADSKSGDRRFEGGDEKRSRGMGGSGGLADLDRQFQQAESFRQGSVERDSVLAEQIRRQQLLVKNMQR